MLKNKALAAAPAAVPQYIEDTFSCYLYTGNGSTQTITNGIDLAGKGGLVWTKLRNQASSHVLYYTEAGVQKFLIPNSTQALDTSTESLTSYNSTGFTLGSSILSNESTRPYASWTFRKAPKFFDVVTYTGDGTGSGGRKINHNLGSVPGFIIIKATSTAGDWHVAARQSSGLYRIGDPASGSPFALNSTNAGLYQTSDIATTTQVNISLGMGVNASIPYTNASGVSYVMYLFAHDAGGFGEAGDQSVVSCGSFTTGSTGVETITLGYEPQYVMMKRADSTGNWIMMDTMRGMPVGGVDAYLYANTSGAETTASYGHPTATGFVIDAGFGSGQTYIYLAIRRGPMKTPTSGTSVFSPNVIASANVTSPWTTGFAVDSTWESSRDPGTTYVGDRLRGNSKYLNTTSTAAEGNFASSFSFDKNTGTMQQGFFSSSATGLITWNFRRAPGFFDVVCYTGTGQIRTVNHNLGVAPELMIVRRRNVTSSANWYVYQQPTRHLILNSTAGDVTSTAWDSTAPTSSVFTVGTVGDVNGAGGTFVAYLFATLPDVSKVGLYTGNGSSQTINCGFSTGARFIMIKRLIGTGDWYVWDTARGIVAANDPHLSLNTTAAEVTTDDSIDPDASGFIVNQVSPTNINNSGTQYLYLAVA